MSTTIKLTGAYSGHEHPVSEETVQDVMAQGDGTTEKRAVAVILHDAGYTNAQVGEAFGDVFGATVKPGGSGNNVNDGLRAIGRGHEIDSGSGSSGRTATPRAKGLKALIAAEREGIMADAARLVERVETAEQALDYDADEVSNAHAEQLAEQLAEIQQALDAHAADPTPFLDSVTAERTKALDAARDAGNRGWGDVERRCTEFEEMTGIALDVPNPLAFEAPAEK